MNCIYRADPHTAIHQERRVVFLHKHCAHIFLHFEEHTESRSILCCAIFSFLRRYLRGVFTFLRRWELLSLGSLPFEKREAVNSASLIEQDNQSSHPSNRSIWGSTCSRLASNTTIGANRSISRNTTANKHSHA